MLALTLQREATPIHIGSSFVWWILAGIIMRPRATSAFTQSASKLSRWATYCISSVSVPRRA